MAGAAAAAFLGLVLKPEPPPPHVLPIQYVISSDAETLLKPLIAEFNGKETKSDGKVIRVTLLPEPSGKVARELGDSMRPVAWTPASSVWAEMVMDPSWIDIGPRTLFHSPEVVAVWPTVANHLHLGSSIPFAELAELVAAHELEFGHTNPRESTSGLFAVVSEYSFFAGKRPRELTSQDVSREELRESVRSFEWSTVHYVDIAKDFSTEWCQYAVDFASAAYMQETTLAGFQQECVTKLKAVVVTDFPFVADYPYIVLTGPWVSQEERDAGEVFGAWLEDRLRSDAKIGENGFRKGKVVPETALGADPNESSSPPPPPPDAQVLKAMQQGWLQLRRPANVMVVVDESQAMASGGKEEYAKEALAQFLTCPGRGLEADDKVGMIAYGGDESEIPIADFDLTRSRLETVVGSLAAQGRAALWDAMERALQDPGLHEKKPVNTIILLTNGTDNSSSTTPEELEAELLALRDRHRPVQVLVVPYGADANSAAILQKHLVTPSLGRYFDEGVSDLGAVKKFICAFQ